MSARLPDWARSLFSEDALDVPVTFAKRGGPLTVAGALAAPDQARPLDGLTDAERASLVRLALAALPRFSLGVAGFGVLDQRAALAALDSGSPAAAVLRNVILGYLRDLLARAVLRRIAGPSARVGLPGSPQPRDEPDLLTGGAGVLVVDGADDGAPPALVDLRVHAYERLRPHDGALTLCVGAAATRARVAAAATSGVGLIVGFGHGAPREFYGRTGDDPVLCADDPACADVSGKIIHLTGCEAGSELGPWLVEQGAIAFFGYADRFTYPTSGDGANAAYDAIATINGSIATGQRAARVHDVAVEAFQECVSRFQEGDPFTGAIFANMLDAFRSPMVDAAYGHPGARLRV